MVAAEIHSEPHFKFISPSKFIRATPTMAVWGAATVAALALFGSDVPLARRDVLSKIPMFGHYFPVQQDKHEQED